MELDELKASWQRLDRRIDELTAINHRLLAETISRKARWRLAPVLVGAVLNMVIGIFFAVVWGSFWSAHLATPVVAGAGIVLHLASIGLIVIGAVRLVLVLRIDYTQPVLTIQRALATSAGVRGALISCGVVCLLGIVAGGIRHAGDGLRGRESLETRTGLPAREFRGVPCGRTRAAATAQLGPSPRRQAGRPHRQLPAQSQHRARQGVDRRARRVRASVTRSRSRYMCRRYWPPTS